MKTKRRDVTIILWIVALIALQGYHIKHFPIIQASSSEMYHFGSLPESQDIINGGVWTEVDKALRDADAFDLYEKIHCTIYHESVKVCGTHNPYCSNYRGNSPLSLDRGYCMYNDYWRPDVTDAVAYNPYLCTTQMVKDFRKGLAERWTAYRYNCK